VKNIDDSLDMLCIIRHGNTDPIEQISEKFNLFVPAILRIRKGNVEFLYHLPRASSENRDMRLFLDKFGARDSGDFFTVLATSNFYPAIGSLNRIYRIPTTVFDGVFLDRGYHSIYFRFNHLFTTEVSQVLLDLQLEDKNRFDLIYLGPSDLKRRAENEYRNHMEISSIALTMNYPEPIHNADKMPVSFAFKAIADAHDLRGLYLFDSPSASNYAFSSNATRISSVFYEDVVNHKYSIKMFDLLMKSPVLLISNRSYYDGAMLNIEFTLSRNTANNFLAILADISREFPESEITILSYSII
jgi:hypothetical protein